MSLMDYRFDTDAGGRIRATLTKLAILERTNRRHAIPARGTISQHRSYIGSRKDLKGCTALIIRSSHPDIVFAQFDYKGKLDIAHPLTHGWHKFPAISFRLLWRAHL